MNLLFITYSFSNCSPAGQVFASLANEMTTKEGIKITAISIPSENLVNRINHVKIQNKIQINERLQKIVMLLTGIAIENYLWIKRVKKEAIRCLAIEKYDYIISFVSGDKPEILNICYELSLKFDVPHYAHMVDSIPPPKHWGLNKHYWNSLKKYVMPGLKNAKLLSFGNQRMLEFQNSLYDFDIAIKSFIVPDAVSGTFMKHGSPSLYTDKIIFTFLGNFYGMRKPDRLFKGFEIFLRSGNNAEIHIYSNGKMDFSEYNLSDDAKSKILLFPFTEKVEDVIKKSTILLDVDIEAVGNVFSSSKLKRYLFNDRFILCITLYDSPSYDLICKLPASCLAVDHDENLIAEAMKKLCNQNFQSHYFEEREEVIEQFEASRIAALILNNLN